MNTSVTRSLAVILIAGLHFGLSCAYVVVAFVLGFGAPQGGDAGYTPMDKQLHDALLRILEIIGWVFGFPIALLQQIGLTLTPAAIINSVLYGVFFIWLGEKLITKYKKSRTMRST